MLRNMTCAMGLCLSLALGSAASAGTVKGKIIFDGDADNFKRTVINTQKDPNCAKSKSKIGTDTVIINTKSDPQTIRNVIVTIKNAPAGDYKAPSDPVVIDQVGCQYTPHVIAMMEGQTLTVRNSDDTNHNIHFLPEKNQEHNFTQPKKGMTKDLDLQVEDPFKVKCDVHPWMGAYIAVYNHPFFDVTGKEGTFEIKNVPAGTYTIEAWHEEFGTQTVEVTVESEGDEKEADLTFKP